MNFRYPFLCFDRENARANNYCANHVSTWILPDYYISLNCIRCWVHRWQGSLGTGVVYWKRCSLMQWKKSSCVNWIQSPLYNPTSSWSILAFYTCLSHTVSNSRFSDLKVSMSNTNYKHGIIFDSVTILPCRRTDSDGKQKNKQIKYSFRNSAKNPVIRAWAECTWAVTSPLQVSLVVVINLPAKSH